MFKTATFKVFLEFLPDVIRQYPALGRPLRLENGIVLFDKLVAEWTIILRFTASLVNGLDNLGVYEPPNSLITYSTFSFVYELRYTQPF